MLARVFSQKHSLSFVSNVGIYSVGAESVYQIVQSGRTEYLAGVLGFTREILARHNNLHPVLTLCIPVMCKAHASLRGKLSHEITARTLLASIAWVFTHSLSNTQPLQSNHTINRRYKRLNKITIKFGTE